MSTSDEATDQQECPVCETENDFFYSYCRRCLAELPTSASDESFV